MSPPPIASTTNYTFCPLRRRLLRRARRIPVRLQKRARVRRDGLAVAGGVNQRVAPRPELHELLGRLARLPIATERTSPPRFDGRCVSALPSTRRRRPRRCGRENGLLDRVGCSSPVVVRVRMDSGLARSHGPFWREWAGVLPDPGVSRFAERRRPNSGLRDREPVSEAKRASRLGSGGLIDGACWRCSTCRDSVYWSGFALRP
jgi:hypothetical protein